MDAAGAWHLYTLGDVRLTRGTSALHFSTRKAASLLAFLILFPEKHTREQLATLFWGDFADDDARHSLRMALSDLRAVLGDDAVIAGREFVQFNPVFPLWTDAVAFQAEAIRFLAAVDIELPVPFVDLYRGDLLPDQDHEWVVPERERLRGLLLDVLLRITQEYRARAEFGQAIRAAQRVLVVDPSSERAHQHLMFCCMASSDRSAALAQYEACRRALQDDLGVEPLPETERLYTWIKGQPEHVVSTEARISNLPVPVTSFVGRTHELAGCLDLLRRPAVRLLTLTGAGGSGKTRLGIEAASAVVAEYPHGVFFIDLAALRQADLLPSAIARPIGVQPAEKQSLSDALLDFLREKQMLLLLDNFEQIIEAAPLLVQLLQVAPRLKLMVTSRAALRLTAEQEYPIHPLATPDLRRLPDLPALSQYDAVALFIARSQAVRPDFQVTSANAPALAEICVRLDGLPLAIELAAARSRLLSPQDMLAQLEHGLEFLIGGARDLPARHRTLRAAIDWSYTLLSPQEQRLFRQLAVFAGGWTLEAAQAACGAVPASPNLGGAGGGSPSIGGQAAVLNGLASLVENSLVRRVEAKDGSVRFSLLETIREYALERLEESGEAEGVRAAHAHYFLAFAEDAEPELHGPDQKQWLDTMETEHDNLRAVLQWAIDTGDANTGLRLATALSELWARRGHQQDAWRWFTALLALPAAQRPSRLRARVLTLAASAASALGQVEQTGTLSAQSLSLCRDLGDKVALAHALLWRADYEPKTTRRAMQEESLALFRQADDRRGTALALMDLTSFVLLEDVNMLAARAANLEALELARAVGDKRLIAAALIMRARLTAEKGDSWRSLEEARSLAEDVGDRTMMSSVLVWSSRVLNRVQSGILMTPESARDGIAMIVEGISIARDLGHRSAVARWQCWLGDMLCRSGDLDAAEAAIAQGMALGRQCNDRFAEVEGYLMLGLLYYLRGDYAASRSAGLQASRLTAHGGSTTWAYRWSVEGLAHCAAVVGDWPRAARLLGAVSAFVTGLGSMFQPLSLSGKCLASVQEHTSDPRVAAAWAEGQAMSVEQAARRELEEMGDVMT
jgi:predicted ATPase/DNA-binding SARP family transcriptional activator